MINDNVPTFNPFNMSIPQLKRCIWLLNMHIRRCFEEGQPNISYLNNWRSDRVRLVRALNAKMVVHPEAAE